MPTLLTYPFDPTGQAVSNRITGEQHPIQEANYRDYYYIVPTYAPFFENDVVITYTAVGGAQRVLVPDVDYYFALPYLGATRSIGVPLFGAISFNNSIVDGTITIDYRTLGGDWTTDPAVVLQNLATLMYNPRIALWDVVTDKPAIFPPINHLQNIDTIYGAQALIDALIMISNTIANSSGTTIVIGGTGGGGGGTGNLSDTYSIECTTDRISNGDTVTFNIIAQGAGVPSTVYWSIVHLTSNLSNFSAQSGTVAMTLQNGLMRGSFTLQCTNNTPIPVGFSLAVHVDNIGGDIVAFTEFIGITNGDMVVAKSGGIDATNSQSNGIVFSAERNTGLANTASKILDMLVNGKSVFTADDNTNTRTMSFGPNNAYRMVWEPDGDIKVFDNTNALLFSTNATATQIYVQNLLNSYASLAYVDAAILASSITKNKLFFFSGM